MDVKLPLPRLPREDVWNPSIEHFVALSLARMRHVVLPNSGDPPPLLFPWAEKMRGEFFTHGDWDEFGNLESEHGRLAHLLSRHPERGAPSSCEPVLRELLDMPSVLGGWRAAVPVLKRHATAAVEGTLAGQHRDVASLLREPAAKSDFVSVPRDYEVSQTTSELSQRLWKRALEEVALQLQQGTASMNGVEFLQIHAYTKDPIYGLERDFEAQCLLFTRLLDTLLQEHEVSHHRRLELQQLQGLERLAAQAAQESSYLANPLMDRVFLIHFHAHHQLPYAKIPLHSLARAEFSVPAHVLEVAEEMLLAVGQNAGSACPIVPILVTTCPPFSETGSARGRRFLTPIIDGNHRATAAILLRFLATNSGLLENSAEVVDEDLSQCLVEYCTLHNLGIKWQVDLMDVLQELCGPGSQHFRSLLRANAGLVRKFGAVEHIPALVVQEVDFLTICKQRSKGKPHPVLLHPFHQTLFNDPDLGLALPQKAGQTHGRPEGFRLLPLTPFGSDVHRESVEVADTLLFQATLRESMNGLPDVPATVVGT